MENTENTLKQSILNLVGFKNDAALKAENDALKSEIETLKGQITNASDNGKAPLVTEIETLKSEISNKANEYDTLKATYDALVITNTSNEAEIAKYKAGGVVVSASDPQNPTDETEEKEIKTYFAPKEGSIADRYLNAAKYKKQLISK